MNSNPLPASSSMFHFDLLPSPVVSRAASAGVKDVPPPQQESAQSAWLLGGALALAVLTLFLWRRGAKKGGNGGNGGGDSGR
jgi:hypothetical protein